MAKKTRIEDIDSEAVINSFRLDDTSIPPEARSTDGNAPVPPPKEAIQELSLIHIFYSFFGVESKDCYRFYTDIKRRKGDSRTYFLEKMQDKLNAKMRHDDELERMRR